MNASKAPFLTTGKRTLKCTFVQEYEGCANTFVVRQTASRGSRQQSLQDRPMEEIPQQHLVFKHRSQLEVLGQRERTLSGTRVCPHPGCEECTPRSRTVMPVGLLGS